MPQRNRRHKRKRAQEEDDTRRHRILFNVQNRSSMLLLLSSSFTKYIFLMVCAIIASQMDYLLSVPVPIVPDYRFHVDFCGTPRTQGLSAEALFRFDEQQLRTLVVALRLPAVMYTDQRDKFHAMEVMTYRCTNLHHLHRVWITVFERVELF